MMKFFLTMKHWQLFGLMVAVPIILIFFDSMTYFTKNTFPIILLIVFLLESIFFQYGWLFIIGKKLNSILYRNVNIKIIVFYIALSIPVLYFIIIIALMSLFDNIIAMNILNHYFELIFMIHILSGISTIISIFYVSKALKWIEMNKKVTFSDYFFEIFMLLIFPIGIWFIQPRINKLFAERTEDENR